MYVFYSHSNSDLFLKILQIFLNFLKSLFKNANKDICCFYSTDDRNLNYNTSNIKRKFHFLEFGKVQNALVQGLRLQEK